MTKHEFMSQMNRVIESFEPNTYGRERLRLIWLEVKELDNYELTKIVDDFIGRNSFRYPPLVPAFREAAQYKLKQRLNRETVKASQKIKEGSGLEDILEKMGAKSLRDAIKKV